MLRESETTPNGLYLIKGKFYGNIVKCQKGTDCKHAGME